MVTGASTETMTDLRQFCSRHAARFWPVRRRALFTLVRNGTCMKCSERRILISFIRPMARPRFCTIRDAWRGARGRKAKRRRTPVWISSSHGTARSRLFMFTSTRHPHKARAEPCIGLHRVKSAGSRFCASCPLFLQSLRRSRDWRVGPRQEPFRNFRNFASHRTQISSICSPSRSL